MSILKTILEYFMSNIKCPPISKIFLTRESAYAMAVLNKEGTYDDVLEKYQKHLLEMIRRAAESGDMYLLVDHKSYLPKEDRETIVKALKERSFDICYTDDRVMLISWATPKRHQDDSQGSV